jgi:hypothetical protein
VNANDTLETASGSKAEMLLTPGVFVRLGSASAVKMVSPSLADTAIEVTRGEVVLEVSELEKENNIRILEHGVTTKILKVGLYRFEGEPAMAQVLEGKAEVEAGDRHVEIGKDHQVMLAENLKPEKFSSKSVDDDLYAWSQTRDEYVSAASYSAAKNVGYSNSFDGFGGYLGPGWAWNSGWNSYAWLPGNGAFFSPFGFGYFSPYAVGYAPIAYLPVNGIRGVAVPVNPSKPVTIGGVTSKPVIPGQAPVAMTAYSGVGRSGGHVTSAAIAHSSAPASHVGYSGGGGGASSGRGYSGGAIAGGGMAHSSASAGAPSAGGGGHK